MKSASLFIVSLIVVVSLLVSASPTLASIETPRAFVAEGGVDPYSLHLLWVNPNSTGLDHVNIYFSNYTSTNPANIGGPPLNEYGSAGTATGAQAQPNQKGEYTITNLADQRGTTSYYYVYIKAVDKTGAESPTTTPLRRQTGTSQDLTSTEPVTGLTTTAVSSTSLRLNWTNPIADDLYQVKIYRSVTSPVIKTDTNLVSTQTVLPNTAGTFTDTGLIASTQYYYLVHTLDVADNFSEPATTSGTTLTIVIVPPVTPPTTPSAPPASETPPSIFPNPRNFDYRATWISQSGVLSADKTAHVIYAHAGDTLTFQLTLKNIGTSSWLANTSDNGNEFRIGTWRTQDRISQFQSSSWLLTNRTTGLSQNVVSGGTVTLAWTMQVPANLAPATYREYFRPLAEYCKWVGPDGIFWDVIVI